MWPLLNCPHLGRVACRSRCSRSARRFRDDDFRADNKGKDIVDTRLPTQAGSDSSWDRKLQLA